VGLPFEVAFYQANDPSASQIDRRQDLEGQVAPALSPW
jgi:hypothetical protein